MAEASLDAEQALALFKEVSKKVREKQDEIRELDASCGDGDLGLTVNKGLKAVEGVLEDYEGEDDLGKILKKAGMEFNNNAASTFGVFFATGCMKAAEVVEGKDRIELSDLPELFSKAADGISRRGDSEVGDKTLLDALVPASEALEEAIEEGKEMGEALVEASRAAKEGAENTVGMEPKTGRAKQLGDRAVQAQDPGATVVYFFLEELAESYGSMEK